MQEKVRSFVEKAKAAVDKLPFAGMAQKGPALSKVAGYANYAACALAVLLVASVTLAACGGKKDGSSAASAKAGTGNSKSAKSKTEKAAPGMEFVTVPAAEFSIPEKRWITVMNRGIFGDSIYSPEAVTVQEFKMAKTETTYNQWYEVLKWATDEARGEKRYRIKNAGLEGRGRGEPINKVEGAAPTNDKNEPVTRISYLDAIVWCNALSEKAGLEPVYYLDGNVIRDSNKLSEIYKIDNRRTFDKVAFVPEEAYQYTLAFTEENFIKTDTTKNGYRLPTRAEWYLAAKGGKPGSYEWDYAYAGGDAASEVGWFPKECGYLGKVKGKDKWDATLPEYGTKPVAGKKANSLGLYDMSGNVSEFVNDCLLNFFEENSTGYYCPVLVGGSWYSEEKIASAADSPNDSNVKVRKASLTYRSGSNGFRVARNAK